MHSQEMIKYEKMAYARPTLNIFKSDFLFLSDHFRPPGTQNEKKKYYRVICLENNGHQGTLYQYDGNFRYHRYNCMQKFIKHIQKKLCEPFYFLLL